MAQINSNIFKGVYQLLFMIIFDLWVAETEGNWILMSCRKCECTVYMCACVFAHVYVCALI